MSDTDYIPHKHRKRGNVSSDYSEDEIPTKKAYGAYDPDSSSEIYVPRNRNPSTVSSQSSCDDDAVAKVSYNTNSYYGSHTDGSSNADYYSLTQSSGEDVVPRKRVYTSSTSYENNLETSSQSEVRVVIAAAIHCWHLLSYLFVNCVSKCVWMVTSLLTFAFTKSFILHSSFSSLAITGK